MAEEVGSLTLDGEPLEGVATKMSATTTNANRKISWNRRGGGRIATGRPKTEYCLGILQSM